MEFVFDEATVRGIWCWSLVSLLFFYLWLRALETVRLPILGGLSKFLVCGERKQLEWKQLRRLRLSKFTKGREHQNGGSGSAGLWR